MPTRANATTPTPCVQPVELAIDLPSSPAAPARARAGVSLFSEFLHRGAFADLQLVLSELVTNSAKYGPGEPIRITVSWDGREITGAVCDRSEGRIELPAAGQSGEPGSGRWGLTMVDRLTAEWGLHDGDRAVWFRLAG